MQINKVIMEKGLTKAKVANMANIPQNDFYQATNGKKTFFPAWRKRAAEALQMSEAELFPEYQGSEKKSERGE